MALGLYVSFVNHPHPLQSPIKVSQPGSKQNFVWAERVLWIGVHAKLYFQTVSSWKKCNIRWR